MVENQNLGFLSKSSKLALSLTLSLQIRNNSIWAELSLDMRTRLVLGVEFCHLNDVGCEGWWLLSPGMWPKPSRNNGEGYRKLADVTSPFHQGPTREVPFAGSENSGKLFTSNKWDRQKWSSKHTPERAEQSAQQTEVHSHTNLPILPDHHVCGHERSQVAVGGFLPEQCLQFSWGRAARENICDNKSVLSRYMENLCFLKIKK